MSRYNAGLNDNALALAFEWYGRVSSRLP